MGRLLLRLLISALALWLTTLIMTPHVTITAYDPSVTAYVVTLVLVALIFGITYATAHVRGLVNVEVRPDELVVSGRKGEQRIRWADVASYQRRVYKGGHERWTFEPKGTGKRVRFWAEGMDRSTKNEMRVAVEERLSTQGPLQRSFLTGRVKVSS